MTDAVTKFVPALIKTRKLATVYLVINLDKYAGFEILHVCKTKRFAEKLTTQERKTRRWSDIFVEAWSLVGAE